MLIDTFDKLMSRRLIYRITFADGSDVRNAQGMKVDLAESDEHADVWICHDETGIWVASNAHTTGRQGYLGNRAFEEPLLAVTHIAFAPV